MTTQASRLVLFGILIGGLLIAGVRAWRNNIVYADHHEQDPKIAAVTADRLRAMEFEENLRQLQQELAELNERLKDPVFSRIRIGNAGVITHSGDSMRINTSVLTIGSEVDAEGSPGARIDLLNGRGNNGRVHLSVNSTGTGSILIANDNTDAVELEPLGARLFSRWGVKGQTKKRKPLNVSQPTVDDMSRLGDAS